MARLHATPDCSQHGVQTPTLQQATQHSPLAFVPHGGIPQEAESCRDDVGVICARRSRERLQPPVVLGGALADRGYLQLSWLALSSLLFTDDFSMTLCGHGKARHAAYKTATPPTWVHRRKAGVDRRKTPVECPWPGLDQRPASRDAALTCWATRTRQVRSTGLEPVTFRSGGGRSIH